MAHASTNRPDRLFAANDNVASRPREGRAVTIAELLAEPIVRDLMRADGVDPASLEALLRGIAAAPSPRRR